ncbi:peptidase S8/S53 domain-containing protein [Flagelloscypha sp. PMI_526]|nr:peptidase S8/S53 domain-containing protein [Flagelloscypha sp. PMI_526]
MRPLSPYFVGLLGAFPTWSFAKQLPNPSFTNRTDAPWHLRSITSNTSVGTIGASYLWNPPSSCQSGEGVVVYVIDSGVDGDHQEFHNIAIDYLAVDQYQHDPIGDSDPQSHGTSMASLIVGQNLGLAPYATVVSVKVTDGTFSNDSAQVWMGKLDEAMDIIFTDFESSRSQTPFGVINLSYPTFQRATDSDPWLAKMRRASELGLIVVTSAGDDGENRCFKDTASPRRSNYTSPNTTQEIVVGASNEFNEVLSLSNRGSCIDLWAPGSRVAAAINPNAYSNHSGTSVAAALVTGMIAFKKSCVLGPDANATRDDFVNLLTEGRYPVLEPLIRVVENTQPWLAKLANASALNIVENIFHQQVPMQSSALYRPWNVVAVSSNNYNSVSNQLQTQWDYDTSNLVSNTTGKGVTIYLLDSGAQFFHPDLSHTSHLLAGEALDIEGVDNANEDARVDSSSNGRGTRMASLLLGSNGGVSPDADVFPIKICLSALDCDNMPNLNPAEYMFRMYEGIRMAIDYFRIQDPNKRKGVISINWPLYYDGNSTWTTLMKQAAALGLYVVVPAGNNALDQCFESEPNPSLEWTRPKKAHEFIVGASTEWNEDASFSSRGPCVDVWAPGTHILAATPVNGTNAYGIRSGTEHSSAIVSGIVAGILSSLPHMSVMDRQKVYDELAAQNNSVNACETCLLGAQGVLAKHAGPLAYP